MWIFDRREKGSIPLTPSLSLAIGMVYVTGADGHLSESERLDLRKVIPDDRILDRALEYCRRTPTSRFLAECAPLLTGEQKLCMLLNMADGAMADGELADEELQVLAEFQRAFAVSDETMAPHVGTLTLKNDRRLFHRRNGTDDRS